MKSATQPFTDQAEQRIRLNVAILTVSDSRTEHTDTSGDYLVQAITDDGHRGAARTIVPDERWAIRQALCNWIVDDGIQVIITNGGTGYGHGKSTLQAVTPLFDQVITGFGELFRHLSYRDIGSASLQSDAIAGLANNTVVFCLPGSTGACRLAWDEIIRPQLDNRQRPCNFATLFA